MANFPHLGLLQEVLESKKKKRDAASGLLDPTWVPTKQEEVDETLKTLGEGAGGFGSATLTLLHQLGRPGSALLSGVMEAGKGANPLLLNPAMAIYLPKETQKTWKDIGTAVKKGFTYETETRGQDFLTQKFRKEHPWASFWSGLVIDVVTDPLGPMSKAVTKPIEAGAKALSKLVMKNPKLSEKISRLSESEIAQMFNINVGDAGIIKKTSDAYRNKVKAAHVRAERFLQARMLEARKIASDKNIPIDQLNRAILHDIETGALGTADSLTAKISPAAVRMANEDKVLYETLIKMEKEAGIPIGDILQRADNITQGYVPHIVTAAAKRIISKRDQATSSGKPLSATHAKRRQQEGTIAEINAGRRGDADKWLHDDPAYLRSVRTARSAQELAYINYNKEMASKFGVKADEAGQFPSGYVSVSGIDDVKFPPKLAKVVKRQRDILRNTTELDNYLKYADSIQNLWKMWTLGVRPAYHMRNVAGNLWNAYSLAGVKNPMWYNRARKMQLLALSETNPTLAARFKSFGLSGKSKGRFNWDEVVTAGDGSKKTMKELFEAAIERGVLGKGQYGVGSDVAINLERDLLRMSQGGFWKASPREKARQLITPTTDNVILRSGFKVGNVLEDNARLAVFMSTFKKTGSLDEAANTVKRALFDYADLSPFERTVMRRVMPFYTWSRKNIPAQIKALWRNPERARKVDIVRHNIEHEQGRPDSQAVYDFYNKGVPIYIGKKEREEIWQMYRMLNYLPIADMERLTEGGQAVMEMTTPLLKSPYEMMRNYDTFRRTQIEKYEGETTDFLGISMPKRLAHLAQLLVPVAEMNRANPFGMFGEAYKDDETGEWKRSKSWGVSQPLVEFEIHRSYVIPGLKTTLGGKYAFGGVERESTRDQSRGVRFMQYALGLRPYYVDTSKGSYYARKGFARDLRSLKYYLAQAEKKGQIRRARDLSDLIDKWHAKEKAAKFAESQGKKADYSWRGSRYYEK